MWDIDRLGLVVARLIVTRLLGPGEPVTVVIDDTLFKRWGRQVYHAFWTHGAMRRSVISPAQRGEMGGTSLDPMAYPASERQYRGREHARKLAVMPRRMG